jgi:hypothetical protein
MQVGLASLRRRPDATLSSANKNTRSGFCPNAQNLPNEATNGLDDALESLLADATGESGSSIGTNDR